MDLLLTILSAILKFVYFLSNPIYSYISKGKKKVVSPITDDLLKVSATDLAEKIRKREISCEVVCKTYIERIKEVNPLLNAVVEERFEAALKEAKNVDDYLTKSSLEPDDLRKIKPLLGVPLTVKESCSLKGLSLCVGTKSRIGYKAETDGEIISRLKTSGAIPLLVSTTPELCLSWETHNLVTGTTRNPYDSTRTAAGSSGGEGALLGAGASLIGVGSDIAGSIRLPALFNGIFGHKPTPRIAPIKGHYPICDDAKYADYLVIGPLTRYAKDLRLLMKVMVGKRALELRLNEEVNLNQIKVFYIDDYSSIFLPSIHGDIKRAIRRSVYYLERTCKSKIIRNYKFPEIDDALSLCGSPLYSIKDIPNLLKAENTSLSLEILKSFVGQSKFSLNVLYFYTLQFIFQTFISDYSVENNLMRQKFIEKLGDNGVLICPTFPTTAIQHHQFYFAMNATNYLLVANSLGLPATHVPCGLNKKGLPIGVQVIAGPNQDRLCLAVAEKLEECFGGWVPPPTK